MDVFEDRNEMLDILAERRTENAEIPELKRMYYEIQYASLDDLSDEDLQDSYDIEIGED